ncbi:MAG TPA: DNA polymerase III subunit gamma and tau [Micromonosporaceae bacterium]|nr:DNA polymerase III subunit gamma and tau [Micromonosporaceae bacterium]
MALALYRKYRPRTFGEVIGQEHVTEPLTVALRTGRLHHAYLFSGPRGCGKTSSARILARSLNCEKGPTPDPCGECDSCRNLAPEGAGSIDVIEIDAASHGGVDDARDLRERAFFAPVASRFKVYVIDEAHMVTPAGFNALLKLVEEPPEYVKFVFATTEPEKVLGTIKSRTHHYPFRLIPPGVLRPYLEELAGREGAAVEPAVFPLVVRAGGGSARDSLSVLDQLVAGAGPEGVTYSRAVALLGVTDVALIDEMCDALAAGDGAAAYATINRVTEAGHDPRRFAADLLERLRDLIVLQQVPDAAEKGLLDAPTDQLERMAAQAAHVGPATLSRSADIVHNGLVEMRGTTAPRLLLELITARLLLPGAEASTGALLQRMERLERRLGAASDPAPPAAAGPAAATSPAVVRPPAGAPAASPPPAQVSGSHTAVPGPAASAPAVPGPGLLPDRAGADAPVPPKPAAAPIPAQAPGPAPAQAPGPGAGPAPAQAPGAGPAPAPPAASAGPAGVIDAAAVRRVWDEVLTMVGRKSKRAAAVVREATVRDVEGDTLVLLFRHQVHADMLSSSPDLLLDAVYEVLGGRWQVRCEHGGRAPAPRPGAGPVPAGNAPGRAGEVPSRGSAAAASTAGPAPGGGSAPPANPASTVSPVSTVSPASAADAASTPGALRTPAGPLAQVAAPEEDWPTPARPGGGVPEQAEPAAVPGAGSPGRSGEGRSGEGRAGRSGGRKTTVRAGADAGRTGGSGRLAARAAGGGRSGPVQPPAGGPWSDGAPPGEPPYDPDYDGSPRGVPAYEGFDPGDEPMEEAVDEPAARQSSEQQALALLQQTFGAEKIGEENRG